MNLLFGTYNLEFGGIDHGDAARLTRQLAMLADARADVWALQECSGWADPRTRTLGTVEEALGMRGYLCDGAHGFPLAVLVRESSGIKVIEQRHEERSPYWHGVAHVVAEVPGHGTIRFASAHLAPSSPTLRAVEAEAFALIAALDDLGPLIAGGDWNAYPTGDPWPDTDGMNPAKVRRKQDTRAAEALEEHMTDVAAHLNDRTPTVGHRRADKLAYRADRIYTTLPYPAITACRVIREEHPESDHRPALAAFTL